MAGEVWKPTERNTKYGVAVCNFHANTILHGLSLRIGETVQILEECGEWFKGRVMRNSHMKGIFPKNCIKIKDAILNNPGPYEMVTPVLEPVVEEVTGVLREWGILLKDFYLERRMQLYSVLRETMNQIMEHRREIIFGKLTKDQQSEVREKVTLKVDFINRKLNLDLVPRVDSEVIDADDTSLVELYKIHVASSERTKPTAKDGRRVSNKFKTLTKYPTVKRTAPVPEKGVVSHHVFISFKSFMCNVGDVSILLFALYDAKSGSYISEKYMAKLTKAGIPFDLELLGKQFGIFTDLTTSDMMKDVYLVCKIFRKGKLVADSKKTANAEYRRPYGAGVIDLYDVISGDHEDEKEYTIPIYNCNEVEFHVLEDYIIRKQNAKYNTFGSNSYGVCVEVKVFHGDVEKVVKEKGKCTLTQRLGFPEVILPGYVRNDFYVTLCKADFEKGSKSSSKNVEVALCAVSERGQVFNDCIYIGSGDKPVSEYRSYVLYHSNSPNWNETIKVSLPIEQFHTAHLRFTFSHCSRNEGKVKGERIFGFSFIKLLQNDGTVIKDDTYSLFIYKLDNSINFASVQSYLRLPHNRSELTKQETTGVVFAGPHRNNKESFTIRTLLCSTKLTQNSDIVHLLQWRKLKHEEILNALESLLKVSPEEVIKFLQDVFDALFNILSENNNDLSVPVFKVLVSITKIVEEVKYEQFKSTLSTYIEQHFSAALAYRSLIYSLCQVVDNCLDSKLKITLKNSMLSIMYICKTIIRSYQLHNSSTESTEVLSDFKELLETFFRSIANMMGVASETLNDTKIDFLKNLPKLCDDVILVLTEQEFSVLVEEVINAIPKTASSTVQAQKLLCLQKIVDSSLFINAGGRKILMPLVLKNLSYQMERKQELLNCLDLLGDCITAVQHLGTSEVSNDISLLSSSMLSILLNVILTIDRRGQMTGLSVACLLGILKLMEKEHYENYLEVYENKIDLRDFMKKLTVAFKELLTMEIFPKDWFTLKTAGNHVILTAVQYFSKAFTDYFLESEYFDQQLWQNYFQLSVLFLTQPTLSLESFPTAKRAKLLRRYDDMRLVMGFEIHAMWDMLGNMKKYFIPGLIGAFLEMTLVPELELRKATIPIFYDMMKVEFAEHHTFKRVEAELIEKLELLMNHKKGDLEFQELFHEIMSNKFTECRDPQLHEEGLKSVHSITELLKRLLDYRVANNDDSNNDQKMMCTVRLLEFYKDLGRPDMYIKYIYKLVELHVLCNNYTEAGFTLQLHASLMDWTDTDLPKFLKFPKQQEWHRKEQLYLEIIDYLDKGKTWESGITLCKELAQLYENKIIDYTKLSEILRKQAYFYDNIMKQMRPAPTYFRVSFYGRGFAHYLKDQVLIYRGLELETLAGFTSRIKNEFPGAEIMYKNTPPDVSIVQGIGQHIQICNVNPVTNEGIFEVKTVDEKISSYYRSNEVTQFVFSRPYHKGEKDPANEFKTLWLERTSHWTKRKFPNILKWSTIESTRKVDMTPIENAIESILSKNQELVNIIEEYKEKKNANVNRLSMILNGVIDANVNGGIANYQNAFLSDEYLFFNADDVDKVQQLKTLLQGQSNILKEGLDIHETFATEQLKPFHEKMVMMYSAMKVSVETGQQLENVLARPNSINLTGTAPGRASPKTNSPRNSPLESRRVGNNLTKTSSDGEITPRREKTPGKTISTSLQNMFRRSSVPHMLSGESTPDSRKAPPLPPRRTSVPSVTGEEDLQSSPTIPSDIPPAALKRLGLQQAGLTASAPSLGFIKEEEAPSLPPRQKRHTGEESHSTFFTEVINSLEVNRDSVFDSSESSFGSSQNVDDSQVPSSRTSSTDGRDDGLNPRTLDGFKEPTSTDLQNMKLYGNISHEKIDDKDFYDSPKELVPIMYFGDDAPPVPAPRNIQGARERPKVPARRSLTQLDVNNQGEEDDDKNDSPPPLPRKSSFRKIS